MHHACLFAVCPASVYGNASVLFSALFTIINLSNLGLDILLAPTITTWTSSKENFCTFFLHHLPLTIACVIALLSIGGIWWGQTHFNLWLIISAAIVIESARKTLRSMLRLVFYNREVAITEIGVLIFYMTMTWLWYWRAGNFSLTTIFAPLVISGFIGTLMLFICAYRWYATLPKASLVLTHMPPLAERIPLVTHQITNTMLSPNLLVLLCSLRLEISQIGTVKLLSTAIQSLALILNKIFGTTTAVVYANHQTTPAQDTTPSVLLSRVLNRGMNLLVGTVAITVMGCYLCGLHISPMVFVTIGLSIVTCLLSTYEQLFISQTAVSWLVFFNVTTLAVIFGLSQLSYQISAYMIMKLFLFLRIATALVISHIAFKRWELLLSTHNKIILISSLITIAILMFKLFL